MFSLCLSVSSAWGGGEGVGGGRRGVPQSQSLVLGPFPRRGKEGFPSPSLWSFPGRWGEGDEGCVGLVSGLRTFPRWGGGDDDKIWVLGPQARTGLGYPIPLARTWSGYPTLPLHRTDLGYPPPPGQDSIGVSHSTPTLPSRTRHATDRMRRGRYASCVFTQEDFIVCVCICVFTNFKTLFHISVSAIIPKYKNMLTFWCMHHNL